MHGLFGMDDPDLEAGIRREAGRRADKGAAVLCVVVGAGVGAAGAIVTAKLFGCSASATYCLIAGGALSAVVVFGWRQRSRERRALRSVLAEMPHRCAKCGYDVRGSAIGTCSECGCAVDDRKAEQDTDAVRMDEGRSE